MQLIILTLCLLLFLALGNTYSNATLSEVTSIYDTANFSMDSKSYPPKIDERVPIMFLGIYIPKIRGNRQAEKIKNRSNA